MSTLAFPTRHLATLQEAAARVLERRGDAAKPETLAYDLLDELYEVCMWTGLDGLIADLERALSLSIPDGSALAEESRLRADLAARLADRSAFDPRGPRAARPRQLAECLLRTLGITVADVPPRPIELGGEVRRAFDAAIQNFVDSAFIGSRLRAAIVAKARVYCDDGYQDAFDRILPHLDDRLAVPRHLKLSVDAVHRVQQKLNDARMEILAEVANDAITRAKHVLAAASPDASDRIDRPITLRLTPREVAIHRMCDPRAVWRPEVYTRILADAVSELTELSWGPALAIAQPYSARQTYAVGDHIDHPKFGRGIVQAAAAQRIEVEFSDGWHTLIHARS